MPKLRHWARTRVPAIALIALVALAYYSAMKAEFVWDDNAYVNHAAPMRSVDGLKQTWLQIESFPQYYPLVHTSFWLEYQLWETLPYGYHVTNIFIHAMCVVVLWKILLLLKVPGAWFAAAIFAVHPVNVESVAWISQRENLLCGLFYLSTLWAYLAWTLADEESRSRWLYGSSLLPFVC
ncbi:MAG: O-GlcNAc transferase, partial [Planctomycetota bacterium]|nr:O-GlcNAc transferase [Planctomycetota bacterium]